MIDEPGIRPRFVEDAFRLSGGAPADISMSPGRLIAIEGTDGTGRSTQIALLREYLETAGFGVLHSALTRSRLAGEGLRRAKHGTTAGQRVLDLYYATDLADRLENHILPALRAGFVVLIDRYIYSIIVRSMVRGIDRSWLLDLYRFAPLPHGVIYLRVDLPHLVPRVVGRGVFDFWESGMDFQEETDYYRSFCRYQARLLAAFDELTRLYDFKVVDANRDVADVFNDVKNHVLTLVSDMKGAQA